MRPFYVPTPALAPMKDNKPSPNRAAARDDELVSSRGLEDGPTEEDWRITLQDVYGGEFTHHIQPIPETGSSDRPIEVHTYLALACLILIQVILCNLKDFHL